jgi:PhnB protein
LCFLFFCENAFSELSDFAAASLVKKLQCLRPHSSFMDVQTTLNFFGRTEEAVQFYGRAIDAETLFLLRFRDGPDRASVRPGLEDKIFHATFRVGSTEIMASDCGCEQPPAASPFAGFSLALRVATPEQAERFFAALGEGGRVQLPLLETLFATRYGIVLDRFGLSWKIMVEAKAAHRDAG